MPAVRGSTEASRAPSALLDTGTRSRSGWWRDSQPAHCASAWACAHTRVTASIDPVAVTRLCLIGIDSSPQIFSGVCRNRSRLRLTAPSVEFSTGTTPKSTVPASAARNTSSKLGHGTASTSCPNCANTACSEKVPAGPRYPTRSRRSSARQAEITSRQIDAIADAGSGPGLSSASRRRICASRSGRSTGAFLACLNAPTSSTSRPRSESSSSSRRSTSSIRVLSSVSRSLMGWILTANRGRRAQPRRRSKSRRWSTSARTPSSGIAL